MSTYNTTYNLTSLMTDFKTCAEAAGFCSVKFGKPEHINFDHNICYDLLNINYPTSYVAEGIKEVYTFELILARPLKRSSKDGVTKFDNDTIAINYDPNAGVDDGTCCYNEPLPCVDGQDTNFPPVFPGDQTKNPVIEEEEEEEIE